MDRRLAGIAIGMCFLLGCTSPVKQLLANASTPDSNKGFGLDEAIGERAEPGEADTYQLMADTITDYINRRYAEGRRPAMRNAHAKPHGCVRATFDVAPGNSEP